MGGKYPTCEQLNKYRFSELVHQNTDLVVLASIWNEDRIPPLKDTVAYLHAQGKKVLIVGPRVHFRGSVPLLLSLQKSLDGLNSRLAGSVIREPVLLDQMRKAIPDAEIIDIASIQCTPGCDVIDGDRLLYLDERHFTVFGAKRIGERFKQRFDLPAFIRGRSSRDN